MKESRIVNSRYAYIYIIASMCVHNILYVPVEIVNGDRSQSENSAFFLDRSVCIAHG